MEFFPLHFVDFVSSRFSMDPLMQ